LNKIKASRLVGKTKKKRKRKRPEGWVKNQSKTHM
jgi:hypothetical protein